MNDKLYLVLSLKEINRLLRAARAEAKAHRKTGRLNHCVVLNLDSLPNIVADDGRVQISSASFSNAVRAVEESTKTHLEVKAMCLRTPEPAYLHKWHCPEAHAYTWAASEAEAVAKAGAPVVKCSQSEAESREHNPHRWAGK